MGPAHVGPVCLQTCMSAEPTRGVLAELTRGSGRADHRHACLVRPTWTPIWKRRAHLKTPPLSELSIWHLYLERHLYLDCHRDTAGRDATGRATSYRDTSGRDTSYRNASDRDTAGALPSPQALRLGGRYDREEKATPMVQVCSSVKMEAALKARTDSLKGPGNADVVGAGEEIAAATSQRISGAAQSCVLRTHANRGTGQIKKRPPDEPGTDEARFKAVPSQALGGKAQSERGRQI